MPAQIGLRTQHPGKATHGFNLYRIGFIRFWLTNNIVQSTVQILSIAFFLFAIFETFSGPQDVKTNVGTLAFFSLWWQPIMLGSLLLFGRVWCYVCPIGAINNFLQRFSLNRRFPTFQKPKWRVAGLSLSILSLTALSFIFARLPMYKFRVVYTPWKVGVYFLVFLVIGALVTLLFRQRAFCRYVCPASGVMTVTSKMSPIEFYQSRETAVPNCMTAEFKSNYLSTDRRCVACMNCTLGQPQNPVHMRFRWPGAAAVKERFPLVDEALVALIIWAVFPVDHVLGSAFGSTAFVKALPAFLPKALPYFTSITAAILAFAVVNKIAALWSGLDTETAFTRFATAYAPLGIVFAAGGQMIAGLLKDGGGVLNRFAAGLGVPLHLPAAWASPHTIAVWSHLSDTWFLWLTMLWGAIIAWQIARDMGKTKVAALKALLPHLVLMSASTYVVMVKMLAMHKG